MLQDMSAVDHPAHYGGEDDPYEVIKVAEAWGFDGDAYLFNVLKYIRREKNDELEDLKKARFYLDRKIRRMEQTQAQYEAALADKPSKPQYIAVRPDPEDPFSSYSVCAHPEWTIETLAAIVATGSNAYPGYMGSFGISLSPKGLLVKQFQTVGWLLESCPPEEYTYYLRKVAA